MMAYFPRLSYYQLGCKSTDGFPILKLSTKKFRENFIPSDYTVVETGQKLAVSTTRPETMFADVCLVVHPDDERYQDLIGKMVINPANGEEIPIIADDYVDLEFGTVS